MLIMFIGLKLSTDDMKWNITIQNCLETLWGLSFSPMLWRYILVPNPNHSDYFSLMRWLGAYEAWCFCTSVFHSSHQHHNHQKLQIRAFSTVLWHLHKWDTHIHVKIYEINIFKILQEHIPTDTCQGPLMPLG